MATYDPAQGTPKQPLPTHLDHKPMVAIDYEDFDGPDAGDTDAKFLSLGLAQWDPIRDMSLKVMRYVKGESGKSKWSRQAEELPIHRVIDLVLLLKIGLFDDLAKPIPAGTFHKQTEDIKAITPNLSVPRGEIRAPGDFAIKNPEAMKIIKNRLGKLWEALNDLKQRGLI